MYIVVRNTPEGLHPSSAPAVYPSIDDAKAEAVRRTLENGGNQVIFKALSAFHPMPIEVAPSEEL